MKTVKIKLDGNELVIVGEHGVRCIEYRLIKNLLQYGVIVKIESGNEVEIEVAE